MSTVRIVGDSNDNATAHRSKASSVLLGGDPTSVDRYLKIAAASVR
jgi:hypothetical protein